MERRVLPTTWVPYSLQRWRILVHYRMSFLIHVRNISSGTVEYYLNVSLAVEHLEESPPASWESPAPPWCSLAVEYPTEESPLAVATYRMSFLRKSSYSLVFSSGRILNGRESSSGSYLPDELPKEVQLLLGVLLWQDGKETLPRGHLRTNLLTILKRRKKYLKN